MSKKIKCDIYTRVSTTMQVDGYSLDAQKEKLKRYAEFQRMLDNIENGTDEVQFVLVFKFSRFGRNAADVLNGDSTATLEYIDQRMAELQEKLVMRVKKDAEYDVIAKEIDALREKKAAVVTKDAEQEMLRKRINEMRHFLQTQTSRITEHAEQLVRRLIEKITVYDDKLIFEFKSGMTIELKR